MAEFLLTTWHGAGTTPPLLSIVRALTRRGHQVRVLADSVLQAEVQAAGGEHISWTRAPQRACRGPQSDFVRDWDTDDPAEAFVRTRDRLSVGPAARFAADVRDEIERRRPAALLTEMLIFGPLVAAEAAGVPAIVLNPTINIIPADGVPPFGFGFLPAASAAERERDRQFLAIGMKGWDGALEALNDARRQHGLPPVDHVLDQGRSAARVLVLTSRAFDFQGPLPPTVKYCGPRLEDPSWVPDRWEAPAGDDPLVLVAMSSEFQGHRSLLQRTVDALGGLPVRAVVTTGPGLDPSSLLAPPNVQVVESAPHGQVLRHARLVVTHAGHGTVIKSLAAGVPLVCLPLGRDQLDIAARVVHSGTGRRLDPGSPAEEIRAAVGEVLGNPDYSAAAGRMSRAIAEEVAEDHAVAEIEAVVSRQDTRIPA
ncbi:MAG TPA: glycosyltransferase [Actinomycetota bacterium]|nr:glycosyltransferase [Actinomycetota bacterium]